MIDEPQTISEVQTISLRVSDPQIGEDDWPCPEDLLERHKEIENLSPVLLNAQAPLVFAIDAPWGGGKTTFIKLWRQYLSTQGKVSLYLNAWESDFAEDPLLPMLSCLDDWLSVVSKESTARQAWDKAKGFAPAILKGGAVAAAKAATFGALDLDKEYEKIASELASGAVGSLVDNFNVQQAALEKFKTLLETALAALPEGQQNLIIFVDELDRCKPTYAIELLERIKHLFEIDRIVFVLSVNRNQLSKSLQGVYGPEFDGSHYLKRFIDLEYQLRVPSRDAYINAQLRQQDFIDYFNSMKDGHSNFEWIKDTFCWLCARFDLTLRDINQHVARLRLILRSIPSNHYLDPQVLAVMLFLRHENSELYQRFTNDASCTNEVIEYLLGGSAETVLLPEVFSVIARVLLESISGKDCFHSLIGYWKEMSEKLDTNSDRRNTIDHLIRIAEHRDYHRSGLNIRKLAFDRVELMRQIKMSME